jgi:electron transfer flavoprotein beta subunit
MSQVSVAVLVSAGCHPVTGTPRAACSDATAFGVAKRVAGDQLHVIHAGSRDEAALLDYLALGAGRIEVVPSSKEVDIAALLTPMLAEFDLVITGSKAERGAGSGLLPYVLAQRLGRPIVANVLDIELRSGEAHVLQFLPRGKRRRLAVTLPAVLVVHPLASAETSYAYARQRRGQIVEAAPPSPAPAVAATAPPWTISSEARRIIPLKAEDKKPAHERLMSAIAAEQKKGTVMADGSPAEKARAILGYLRQHHLIEF